MFEKQARTEVRKNKQDKAILLFLMNGHPLGCS
jgi:hypothetical protein